MSPKYNNFKNKNIESRKTLKTKMFKVKKTTIIKIVQNKYNKTFKNHVFTFL